MHLGQGAMCSWAELARLWRKHYGNRGEKRISIHPCFIMSNNKTVVWHGFKQLFTSVCCILHRHKDKCWLICYTAAKTCVVASLQATAFQCGALMCLFFQIRSHLVNIKSHPGRLFHIKQVAHFNRSKKNKKNKGKKPQPRLACKTQTGGRAYSAPNRYTQR